MISEYARALVAHTKRRLGNYPSVEHVRSVATDLLGVAATAIMDAARIAPTIEAREDKARRMVSAALMAMEKIANET